MSVGPSRRLLLFILVLAPLAGCGTAHHEQAIRQRCQELIGHLCRGDLDACVPYADPIYVRAQGAGKVKFAFGVMSTLLKIGQQNEQTVLIDEVRVGEDRKTATVRLSLQLGDQRKPLDPSRWVLSEGQWYITF